MSTPAPAKMFVTRLPTRDLFAVADLLCLTAAARLTTCVLFGTIKHWLEALNMQLSHCLSFTTVFVTSHFSRDPK